LREFVNLQTANPSFDRLRGRLKIEYFEKIKGRIKYPNDIGEIIQGVAYLVDTEALPTDFTRFRRMTERRDSRRDSKEQAQLLELLKVY
jgi:hypothetical protein